MKVQILEHIWEVENDQNVVGDLIEKVFSTLESSRLHYSHMIINGVEVYDDMYEYMTENIAQLQHVEIVAKTIKHMIDDLLLSLEEYLQRAIPEVKGLAEEFYQSSQPESWEKFALLVEGMQALLNTISAIDKHQINYHNQESYLMLSASLQVQIAELLQAVEEKDTTLLADLLTYEIIPLLDSIYSEIRETIDKEVTRNDIS